MSHRRDALDRGDDEWWAALALIGNHEHNEVNELFEHDRLQRDGRHTARTRSRTSASQPRAWADAARSG